jgi:hypothetical protein
MGNSGGSGVPSALTLGAVIVTEYEGPLQRYVLSLKRG